jgi:hypothetical protein
LHTPFLGIIHQSLQEAGMIARSQYMDKIRPFIGHTEMVKVLTGLRRSGKSVMFQLIQQELLSRGIAAEAILTYNFEDLQQTEWKEALSLHAHLKDRLDKLPGTKYLFLDEVQEVYQWEKCVNSLRMNSDVDIYVTGSNASMLAGEFATYLAGRYITIQMHPFSFQEYCLATRQRFPDRTDEECFRAYLKTGGMPFLHHLDADEASQRQYLRDLFTSVVIKDILKRNAFRDVDLLERIIQYAMANVGTTFSANSVSRFLKSERRTVAPETVMNYLKACEEAFLLIRVPRQDLIGKRILQIQEKYYLADHGIREAVQGTNLRDIERVLENMVCVELLRQGYDVTVGKVGEKEVDFVCDRSGDRMYVQVAYLLASEETIAREFGAFDDIPDHYPRWVLSLDAFDMGRNGIRHRNIREFLGGREL